MYPHSHFLAGLTAGQIGAKLEYFNQTEAWLIALLAVLVDLDHYFYFCHKYKNLSFHEAWQAAVIKKETGERTAVHHWQGFVVASILIILIAIYDFKWALIIALAYYSHMLLDYVPQTKKKIFFKMFNLNFKLSYQEILTDIIFFGVILILL